LRHDISFLSMPFEKEKDAFRSSILTFAGGVLAFSNI
jgi:hypothetical protein